MNICSYTKKGAMFGLDARIALAIFGALSVISGAALFSAIQDARVTAMVVYFEDMAKAYESLYIDTAAHNQHGCYLTTNNPAIQGWNGPYIRTTPQANCSGTQSVAIDDPFLNAVSTSSSYRGEIVLTGSGIFGTLKDTAWTTYPEPCATNDCSVYYSHRSPSGNINGTEFNRIAALLDEKIDGGDGALKGKFRYDTGVVYNWYYKVMPK